MLALVLGAFAYMDGVIDPPSSAHRLTPVSLAAKAEAEASPAKTLAPSRDELDISFIRDGLAALARASA